MLIRIVLISVFGKLLPSLNNKKFIKFSILVFLPVFACTANAASGVWTDANGGRAHTQPSFYKDAGGPQSVEFSSAVKRMGYSDGESVDLQAGIVSLTHTDFSIPLNGGMKLEVSRNYRTKKIKGHDYPGSTAWAVTAPTLRLVNSNATVAEMCRGPAGIGKLPPIKIRTNSSRVILNITLPDHDETNSYMARPDSFGTRTTVQYGEIDIPAQDADIERPFYGLQLLLPGEAPKPLLIANQQWDATVTNGSKYVTTDNWKGDCLTGGGFKVTSPDGIVYIFDKHAVRNTSTYENIAINIPLACYASDYRYSEFTELDEMTGRGQDFTWRALSCQLEVSSNMK